MQHILLHLQPLHFRMSSHDRTNVYHIIQNMKVWSAWPALENKFLLLLFFKHKVNWWTTWNDMGNMYKLTSILATPRKEWRLPILQCHDHHIHHSLHYLQVLLSLKQWSSWANVVQSQLYSRLITMSIVIVLFHSLQELHDGRYITCSLT